jgi:hypothetical protein
MARDTDLSQTDIDDKLAALEEPVEVEVEPLPRTTQMRKNPIHLRVTTTKRKMGQLIAKKG